MINILKENATVLININIILLFINLAKKSVIPSDKAVCSTPKIISCFIGAKKKFANNTPITIQKKYFLFKKLTKKSYITSDKAVCNKTKIISCFNGAKKKFANNTPITIPKKYFLFKTIK